MSALRKLLIFWTPLAAWFVVIYSLSSTPGRYLPHLPFPHADKASHIVEYFVLGALMMRAFCNSFHKVSLAKFAILAIIISLCYGVFDELCQRMVPGRTFDLLDLAADCAGACAGIFLYLYDIRIKGGRLAADNAVSGYTI